MKNKMKKTRKSKGRKKCETVTGNQLYSSNRSKCNLKKINQTDSYLCAPLSLPRMLRFYSGKKQHTERKKGQEETKKSRSEKKVLNSVVSKQESIPERIFENLQGCLDFKIETIYDSI
jgi:hypothetical protein